MRRVPFLAATIPVLDCFTLAVFKAFYDRTRDWADIEAMDEAGQLDRIALREALAELIGPCDARLDRLDALRR